MKNLMKKIAAKFPEKWQFELKRFHYARQIKNGRFDPGEPEYEVLPQLLNLGDWVIDIGANIGNYTRRFSELVGAQGRVIAIEPVPETFAILASNSRLFPFENITLLNAAVSNSTKVAGMKIPHLHSGLKNYCEAHLCSSQTDLSVISISIDQLNFENKIALVKIDAEGHEEFVLDGMTDLITESRPCLIIETGLERIIDRLKNLGYKAETLPDSPNVIFKPDLRYEDKKLFSNRESVCLDV